MITSPIRQALLTCLATVCCMGADGQATAPVPHWEPCGWGGGGWYWATVFHPSKAGVIYLGLDVGGVCKTTDHGMTWKTMNVGLTDYSVYSLAVDRSHPETVYAATEGGLHKSIDGGEHWRLLPKTGPKDLRITAERDRSVRSIAVDPVNGDNLYAASPGGKLFTSKDGGETWTETYAGVAPETMRGAISVQFGKVDAQYFGGVWIPIAIPAEAIKAGCAGIGFACKGDGSQPERTFLTLTTSSGGRYQSRNISDLFKDTEWRDALLKTDEFAVEPDFATKHPDAAAAMPVHPDWATVNRIDLGCNGNLPANAAVVVFDRVFVSTGTGAGATSTTIRDFAADATVQTYGNVRVGKPQPEARGAFSIAVSQKDPSLVIAATTHSGLVMSRDAGKTWKHLKTPKTATSAMFYAGDPDIVFASFSVDGIWKSIDRGETWTRCEGGLAPKAPFREVAVSPVSPLDVIAIGDTYVYRSSDGGATWADATVLNVDLTGNPTRHFMGTNPKSKIVHPMNVSFSPADPKELFISADWRSAWSGDGGVTWSERERGADISCITDIRFSKGRAYATAMDEGTLVSEDNGTNWRQIWPLTYIADLSGHYWRLAVDRIGGADRIISTASPWNSPLKRVVVSKDGGATFKDTVSGLPDYQVRANTMWGEGHPRALAVDPNDPKLVYMGLDGDASDGKMGGGVFASVDGGETWKQLPNQPGSRRMYNGLAVDPSDSKRIFWGSCGTGGGVWSSTDGGDTWENAFTGETWIWNVLVAKDGAIYAGGANLWKSADHGKTWTQLTTFTNGRAIVGMEADPRDPKTFWISAITWNSSSDGGIFKTTDAGATWHEITGDIPCAKPQVLRFNAETNELWAGWVGMYRLKQ